MAPTKHKRETTKVGEEVLGLVIPYIDNSDDLNSVSLVSHSLYEIDRITRKRLTVHTLYYPNPASLSNRFPFIESLTLKGPPSDFISTYRNAIQITPWIEHLALEFRYLKELHIRGLVVRDEDLETLARTRGKDLRSLKIKKCEGFSSAGLWHVSKHCNQLRTLCFKYCSYIGGTDEDWLHQLALNSMVLERFHSENMLIFDAKYLTILAKNCCNSLISLKLGVCFLSQLGDIFRYAVRLEQFRGDSWDEVGELDGFQFPPNMRSLSIGDLPRYSIVLPFLNEIKKLELLGFDNRCCQCLLFERCPNLEVLFTRDVFGDRGLQVIGQFCKKLRKLTHDGVVTHVGLIDVAKGCSNLESLKVGLKDISNEALECVGTHLKNLRVFRICLGNQDNITDLPLDNGVRAMLIGCNKLERLDISLRHDGLTDVGLEYIGKYGANLRSLSLTHIGKSNAGLVKLLDGCQRLRKLKLRGCPFSEQVVTRYVFNILSLRYALFENTHRESINCEISDCESSNCDSSDCESSDRESRDHKGGDRESGDHESTYLALTRPEFQL